MRDYKVLRAGTALVEDPDWSDADKPHHKTVAVYFDCGTRAATGDEQACKAACAEDLADGSIDGQVAPTYIAVTGRGFHEHTMAISTTPQIGIKR